LKSDLPEAIDLAQAIERAKDQLSPRLAGRVRFIGGTIDEIGVNGSNDITVFSQLFGQIVVT
jgi:hypothetical protein